MEVLKLVDVLKLVEVLKRKLCMVKTKHLSIATTVCLTVLLVNENINHVCVCPSMCLMFAKTIFIKLICKLFKPSLLESINMNIKFYNQYHSFLSILRTQKGIIKATPLRRYISAGKCFSDLGPQTFLLKRNLAPR